MGESWSLTAAQLGAAYREGSLEPLGTARDLLRRIDRINPKINAYVALADDLEEQARDSARRIALGAARSPLEGVPVALKDNLVMAGLPAAWGSAALSGKLHQSDEIPVARLRAAGALLVGKTNTPEFAVEGYTSNATFGTTGNPWNPALTPGGSSGGAAAAVAAGLATIGIGTDGGGSIRRPAGHCGLFGLKPGIGTVPRGGGLPQILLDFEVVGPLTRSTADLRLVLDVIGGPSREDPASRLQRPRPERRQSLKILLVERFADSPCDPEILTSVRAAASRFTAMGCEVETGPLPVDLERINTFWGSFAQIGLAQLRRTLPEVARRGGTLYLDMAAAGDIIAARDLFAALDAVRALRADLSRGMGAWDLILTPTAAAQPWPAGDVYPQEIDGQAVGPRGHAIYTGWVNAAGHPAVALPARPDAAGMPIGLQLVGDLGAETLLLDLAEAYEAQMPSWRFPEL